MPNCFVVARMSPSVRAFQVVVRFGMIATALQAASATWAQQTPFISNLSQPDSGLTMFTTTSDRFAQSFTPSMAYSSSLYATLGLALQSSSVSTVDTVHLYLYSDGPGTILNGAYLNSDQPVSQIADFGTVNVNSTTTANYSFSSAASVSLTANTIYWLVLQDDASSNAGWSYTTSTSYTGPATINNNAATGSSPDSGSSYLINNLAFGPQRFEVGTVTSSNALPEPGSWLFFVGGILGTAALLAPRIANRRKDRVAYCSPYQKGRL